MTFDSLATDSGRTARPEEYLGYSPETLQLVIERSARARARSKELTAMARASGVVRNAMIRRWAGEIPTMSSTGSGG
jgi:hypothetical protein